MNKFFSMILCMTLALALSACGGGGASGTSSPTAKQSVTFSFSKSSLVSVKTAAKSLASATLDPTAVSAAITVTDTSGNVVLSNYKISIYSLNGSYITATVPLSPGNYQITQFLVLDSNNNILYLVPTQSATADIKALVSTVLPLSFGVSTDQANTVTVQVLAPDGATAQDYGYPSIAFSIVDYVSFMSCVQILDSATNSWQLTGAALTVNGATYSHPAQTSTLRVAKADSYTLVFSKAGYDTKTITLSSATIANYQTTPLVVMLTPTVYHTVTFNSNGGTTVATQSVADGGVATAPASPTKSGYDFAGWYNDAGLTSAFNFSAPITANITLYAKWAAVGAGFTFTWSNPPVNTLMIGGVYRNGTGAVTLYGSSFVATVAGAGGGGSFNSGSGASNTNSYNGDGGGDSQVFADEATYLTAYGGEGAVEEFRNGYNGGAYGVGFSSTTFSTGGGAAGGYNNDGFGGNGGLAIGTQTKTGSYACSVGAGGADFGANGSITIVINP